MLFKLLVPFTLVAVIGVRTTPVFDFPDVIHRSEIPAGITVYESNATVEALGAAATSKLESRDDWEKQSNCFGSAICYWGMPGSNDCRAATNVRYRKETQTQTHILRGNSFSQLRGVLCGLADSFLDDSSHRL